MRLKLLADTSFLISASLIGITPTLLKSDDLIVTEQVRKELLRISRYRDKEGASAKSCIMLMELGRIKVTKLEAGRIQGLGMGESSCIKLFKKEKFNALCIDDIDAIRKIAKEIGKENILTSFDIIRYLHKLGLIGKNKSKKLTKQLLFARKWKTSTSMLELARKSNLL